jgi:hypothetical protein
MILLHTYSDNLVWFAAWEEITELIFILGTGIVLIIFWQGLLPPFHLTRINEPERQRPSNPKT